MFVYDLIKNDISLENLQEFSTKDNVLIYAHYSNSKTPTYSESKQIEAFIEAGWKVVVTTTNTYFTEDVTTLRKPNIGYDMGSWSTALLAIPELRNVNSIILMNNSFYGPIQDIQPMLKTFVNKDYWGMTKSQEFGLHMQSGIRGFSNKILQDNLVYDFITKIEIDQSKSIDEYRNSLIFKYEVGFPISYVLAKGYKVGAMFHVEDFDGLVGHDLTLSGWRMIVEKGAPFVKKSLALNFRSVPHNAPTITLYDIINLQNIFGKEIGKYFVE
jgi:lipopolysaccharide biosynthesis protein